MKKKFIKKPKIAKKPEEKKVSKVFNQLNYLVDIPKIEFDIFNDTSKFELKIFSKKEEKNYWDLIREINKLKII